MTQNQALLLMLNNYFHDVATAMLLASGVLVWAVGRAIRGSSNAEVSSFFLKIYRFMTRLAVFSLTWIVIGGIPRTIFYREFEWANAAGKNQVHALLIKHLLAFIFVGGGAVMWVRLGRAAREIRRSSGSHG